MEVVNTAYYLVNRSPSATINYKTQEEVWCREYFCCSTHAPMNDGKFIRNIYFYSKNIPKLFIPKSNLLNQTSTKHNFLIL